MRYGKRILYTTVGSAALGWLAPALCTAAAAPAGTAPFELNLLSLTRYPADAPPENPNQLTLAPAAPFAYAYAADSAAPDATTSPGGQGTETVQPAASRPAPPSPAFGFRKGTWDLELSGSHMSPVRHTHDYLNAGSLAVGYFVADGFSINAAVVGYSIEQPNNDAVAVGFDLYARWYFLTLDRFSVYGDIGAGAITADQRVPEGGTNFNFTPRGGFGLSYRVADNVYLLGGIRYWHLSNAGFHGIARNPSYDSIQYYGGVMFTF